MDFWRSGQARTYRDPLAIRKGMGWWQRLTGFHFPAWVPVAFISVVVMAILVGLFFIRGAAASPKIGDHFHAPITILVCGERQTRFAEFEPSGGSPGTHGDDVIHLHPFAPQGEGAGSNLRNYFDVGRGKLTSSELKLWGKKDTYNVDKSDCDGKRAEIRVLRADSGIHPLGGDFNTAITKCDGLPESAYENVGERYIPKDGDCIRVVFGPPEVAPVVQSDRTIIAPDQVEREIEMDVTGSADATVFSPASIELKAGETVRVVFRNKAEPVEGGRPLHGLRFSGTDRQYGTSDDYVTELPTIHPGEEGYAVIRFDTPGEYEFRDEGEEEGVTPVTGKVVVSEAEATPAPGTTPTPVPADVSLDVSATDTAFEPSTLVVEAGKRFRIRVANNGTFIHNLRIAGPDGEYQTEDDIVTEDYINPGGQGEVSGQIDGPGEYAFRCDFHPTVHAGTVRIQ